MANAAVQTDHWLGPLARPGARWARRLHLTPSGLGRIGLLLTVPAAVWFTEPGPRGVLLGSLFLAAALVTDAVAAELADGRRDALETWLTAMLSRLREYLVYLGLAVAGTLSGLPDAWAWAAGALIAVALRDSVVAAHRARPGPGPSAAPAGVSVPAPRRGGLSLIDAVDPGDRAPSDPTLTAELFGTAGEATGTGETGAGGTDRHDRRERDAGPDAARYAGGAADPALPPAIRRMLTFPQAARFATVALTITIWDPRVTFIALIVGCGVAITAEVVDQPVHPEAR